MFKPLGRWIVPVALIVLSSGCGLAETGAAAASAGASSAEAAQEARKTQERVEAKLEAAQDAAAEQRRAIEEQSE